ncbi:solute carrier family 23 member 2-like [Haliotis rufescens]|uniref:solute carrier family 23 member 2-like n=1 Tax=Haliotis rufescens TaxID=6454 RepID=UPI00201E7BB3|nr:solute carrier family 23 member 2-like [Haliotis rufescens]
MCVPSFLVMSFLAAEIVGADHDSLIRTQLFSTVIFTSGACTLLQTALGARLPMIQGPAASFLPALLAAQRSREWSCTDSSTDNNSTDYNSTYYNSTDYNITDDGYNNTTSTLDTVPRADLPTCLSPEDKLREISGSLMAASAVEILIGGTGLVGLLMKFVGPVTVAPTIALVGLSVYKVPIAYTRSSWELSLLGVVLVVLFALYLGHIAVPFPTRSACCAQHRRRKSKTHGVLIFQLLPVLLSILVVWAVSGILTHANVFPTDPANPRFKARTDAKSTMLHRTPWFYVPHPGQFGMPSFNIGLFIGFIAGFLASIIESVGDYFAAAKACEVTTPPKHAINRGIFIEGLGGLLSGAVGFGLSTTSYTPNIAAMTLTKTAHRYIMYSAGAIMLVLSVVGKVGAALATVPDPALAGAIVATCGMMVTLGLSSLQYVNMNSSRNLLIVGMALFIGIFLPEWLERHPEDFETGVKDLDKIPQLILGTPMLLGGLIAIFLDNTAKGSRKDRGIDAWQNLLGTNTSITQKPMETSSDNTYGWFWQGRLYQYLPCCSRLPFMPPGTGLDRTLTSPSQPGGTPDNVRSLLGNSSV